MTDSTKEQILYENLLLSNFASINFIRQASAMLDLPVRTTGTALYYYHRFHQFMSINQNTKNPKNQKIVDENLPLYTNEELLVTTCLHLACKATEVPRKVRDLVNVGYRYFYPEDNILEVSEIYFKMRTTLTKSELLLVRALDFNLEVELPFTFCLTVLRNMGSIPFFYSLSDTSSASSPYINGTTSISFQKIWKKMEQDMPINFNSIARVAWMFVWDSLCCPKLSLKYSIAEVGLGCLYLALRTSYADLQMTMTDWVDMWGASNNISVQTVRDVVMDLIELYEQSGLNNSNDDSNSALKE